jgi:hypothetical protein
VQAVLGADLQVALAVGPRHILIHACGAGSQAWGRGCVMCGATGDGVRPPQQRLCLRLKKALPLTGGAVARLWAVVHRQVEHLWQLWVEQLEVGGLVVLVVGVAPAGAG